MKRTQTRNKQLEVFINRNISVNSHTIDFIMNSFFKYGSKKILVNKDMGEVIELGGSREIVQQIVLYSTFFGHEISEHEAKFIATSVIPMNSISTITIERDILANENTAIINDKELILIKAGLPKTAIDGSKNDIDKVFMRSFKKHFPFLNRMIDMIILNHVTPQKNSFLAIKARSNAGKTLIMKALDMAGLTKEVNFQQLTEKASVSPYSPDELNNSLSLIEDEFKFFTDSMKNFTFNTSIAPKGQMAKRVKVGMKIMLFANDSASFNGGVDEQITNRVIYYDWDSTPITGKSFYKELGFTRTVNMLALYIRNRAEELIRLLRKKENVDTYVYEKFSEFQDKLGLDKRETVIDVNDAISEAIVIGVNEETHNPDIIQLSDTEVLIKKPIKTIRKLLESSFDDGKVKHLASRIDSWLSERSTDHRARPKYINGKAHKGVIINPVELYNQFTIQDGNKVTVAEVVNGHLVR